MNSDPQAVFRALVTPATLLRWHRFGEAQVELPSPCEDSRDGRDWKPREPLPGPLGQREEVDR